MEVAKLSAEMRVIFDKFVQAVSDCRHPDWSDDYLLKWLIARDFDLAKSEAMLRRSVEWRQINQIDGIVERWIPPEVLRKYYSIGTPGYDKFGCPIWICAFGRMDVIGILQSVSKRDYIRYVTYFMERSVKLVNQNNNATGKSISYQTLIVDLEHFSVNQITYKPFSDVGLESVRMSEANYPEGVRRVFLINVPQIFTMIFSMIKPFLGQATIGKIRIFGYDSKAWKAALLEEIEANQLPVHYGGSMTDPDGNPMCLTKISMGGEVPKSYYRTKNKPKPGHHMMSDLITAGKRKRIEININHARSLLKWQFITEDGDIGFQILFMKSNGDEMPMIPRDIIESHKIMEEGEISCIYHGTYIIEFDNSYSYFRSKKLWYFIDIIKSE